jgi:hypothetical protein
MYDTPPMASLRVSPPGAPKPAPNRFGGWEPKTVPHRDRLNTAGRGRAPKMCPAALANPSNQGFSWGRRQCAAPPTRPVSTELTTRWYRTRPPVRKPVGPGPASGRHRPCRSTVQSTEPQTEASGPQTGETGPGTDLPENCVI